MPILETGNRAGQLQPGAGRGEQGFTLVELLVVLFIIALMSTLVVMSLPAQSDPLGKAARELSQRLSQASRESILTGNAIALASRADGALRFERFQDGDWVAMAPLDLGEGGAGALSVRFAHESETLRPAALPERGEGEGEGEGDTAGARFARQVIFSPVGEATPVRIQLRSANSAAVIRVGDTGEVRLDIDA